MSFRRSSSFGKRQEFIAIAELLKRGHDVYQTLVDDQGIDCIIRKVISNVPTYVDLQIKARSSDAQIKHAGRWAALSIPNPRRNYLFMFYSEPLETYWIVPSLDLTRSLAYQNKSGKNEGKYTIQFSGRSKGKAYPKEKYGKYQDENGFKILEKTLNTLE